EIEDPALLETWFANLAESAQMDLVKRNSEREVFRISAGGRDMHVKYSHPVSSFQRFRSIIKPKLKSEFAAAKLFESLGVPVTRCLGWGSRFSESMLLTESEVDSSDARTHWFGEACLDPERKKQFLASFADFLALFIDAGVKHPDFHSGNILVVSSKDVHVPEFTLVDVYGARRSKRSRDYRGFAAVAVVGAFRGEMTDVEGMEFIARAFGGDRSLEKCAELWTRLLNREATRSDALWRKRKSKMLVDPRYSRMLDLPDGRQCRVRISLARRPTLELADVETTLDADGSENFLVERVSSSEALKRWGRSSMLELHRLPHNRVLGWIENDSGKDEILVERDAPAILSDEETARRYAIAGLLSWS
ncbi:MAG: hypothetical protein KAG97_04430, partial [Victivallales bacterium]|nr:hypothetical protein [Victivallales bacterium]